MRLANRVDTMSRKGSGGDPADIDQLLGEVESAKARVREHWVSHAKDEQRRFAHNLAAVMRAHGLSADKLAERTALSSESIRLFLAEKTSPRFENLLQMVLALGLTIGELDRPEDEFARWLKSQPKS